MRIKTGLLIGLGLLAGCATEPRQRDPQQCVALLNQYDQLEKLYPQDRDGIGVGAFRLNSPLTQQIALIRAARCLTFTRDLEGMEALGASLAPHAPAGGGAAIAPKAMHAGIVTNMEDEARAKAFFSALGYGVRGVGAEGLGRRIYVGPFTSQAALEEALDIAWRAGFVSAYTSRYVRF